MRDVWILLVMAYGDGEDGYGKRPLVHEFHTAKAADEARKFFMDGACKVCVVSETRND